MYVDKFTTFKYNKDNVYRDDHFDLSIIFFNFILGSPYYFVFESVDSRFRKMFSAFFPTGVNKRRFCCCFLCDTNDSSWASSASWGSWKVRKAWLYSYYVFRALIPWLCSLCKCVRTNLRPRKQLLRAKKCLNEWKRHQNMLLKYVNDETWLY